MPDFDPYRKWLGIPPKDQPPNHYRLLGIDLFESDPDVIDTAANKQMAYLHGCATGQHAPLAEKLLNEISQARLCLLDAKKKAAYDAELKKKLPTRRTDKKSVKQLAKPAPHPGVQFGVAPSTGIISRPSKRQRQSKKPWLILSAIGGTVAIVVVVAVLILVLNGGGNSNDERKKVANVNSPKNKAKTKQPSANDSNPKNKVPEPKEKPKPLPVKKNGGTKTIDLLSIIPPKQVNPHGSKWQQDGNAFVSSLEKQNSLVFPYSPTMEYELRLEIERVNGDHGVVIGLPIGIQQCLVGIDRGNNKIGHFSGLELLDGSMFNGNPTRRNDQLLKQGKKSEIVCRVRSDEIQVTVDDKPVVAYIGSMARLSMNPVWKVPNYRQLFLGTHLTSFKITKAEVKESSTSLAKSADLLKLLNERKKQIVHTAARGGWTLNNDAFEIYDIGNDDLGIELPYSPPKRYRLSIRIQLVKGGDEFRIRLPVGNKRRFVASLSPKRKYPGHDAAQVFDGKSTRQIICAVSDNRLVVDVNGKRLIDWSGDFKRLPKQTDKFGIGCAYRSRFKITMMEVTPLSEQEVAEMSKANNKLPSTTKVLTGIDLLARIDPLRDSIRGKWSKLNGVLIAPGARGSIVQIPLTPPLNYKLSLRADRPFVMGLVTGKRQFTFNFNRKDCAIVLVGKNGKPNPIFRPISWPSGKSALIQCSVQRSGVKLRITATMNDTMVISWHGDVRRLYRPAEWKTKNPIVLFVGANNKCRLSDIRLIGL